MLERRNLRTASLLHATSRAEADGLRLRGLSNPVAIIPNGVNLPVLAYQPGGEHRPRKDGTRTALYLGRIHPVKGLPLLVEAWCKIKPPGWRLRIVGPDEDRHREHLESLVAKMMVAETVTFSEAVRGSAKADVFQEADLFILPTYSENFGVAVAEAMAYQLPVITTFGAPWGLLESERCGWWVPASVDGIASALQAATRLPDRELREMGSRARRVVSERFSWDRIGEQFAECYRWLLGHDTRPGCVEAL